MTTDLPSLNPRPLEGSELLRAVIEAAPGFIAYWDAELRLQLANAHPAMTKQDYRPLLGCHMREVLGEDVFVRAEPYARAALRGEPQRLEREFRKPDGSMAYLVARYMPHRVDGEVVGFAAFVTDTAEVRHARREVELQKQAFEQQLREGAAARDASEQLFAKLFRSSPAALAIRRLSDNRIVDVNERYLELTGFAREEVVGRTSVEIGLETAERAHARELAVAAVRRADGSVRNVEMPFTRKSGEIRVALVSLERIDFGSEGPCSLATLIDITERKQAEQALRISEERLQTVIGNLSEGLVLSTAAGLVLHWNPAARALHGLPDEEDWNRALSDFQSTFELRRVDGTLLPFDEWPLMKILRGEVLRDYELKIRRLDMEWSRVFSYGGSLVLQPDGTKLGVLTINDITERQRRDELRRVSEQLAEENRRIQEASRLKSEFLANMSHELRTPLNAIIGFAALLRAGKAGAVSEQQTEYLDDVLTSAKHLLQLINDVLDLAKIEAGRVQVNIAEVDIAKLLAEVRDVVRGLAAQKQLSVSLEIEPSLGRVQADERLLKQILYNYLSNAIKFTANGGQVWVRVLAHGANELRIEVEDTGIGISEQDVARLFVEFQQLDVGSDRKYQGTGLGLVLAKKCAEAQGGRAGVSSVLGHGSRFWVTLPRPES